MATIPTAPAIVNAVCNALEIDINDLPLIPEKIMNLIDKMEGWKAL